MDSPDDAFRVRKPKRKHPTGFEPGYHLGEEGGFVVTRPLQEQPDEHDTEWGWVLDQWGLDPAHYTVEPPVEVRSWDQAIGNGEVRTAYYVKAKVTRHSDDTGPDYDSLRKWIRKRPKPRKPAPSGDQALVVCLSDWQLGKADGWGTEGVIRCVKALEEQVLEHAAGLRAAGVGLRTLAVLGGGDIVENCDGHYAMQTHQVQLNRRRQLETAQELIASALDAWAPHFERVQVACVGGNHGENRKAGKAFTDFDDNDDVAAFSNVRWAFSHNQTGRYDHFGWVIPDDQLSVSLDIEGTVVGLTHGHQSSGGRFPDTKVWEWWRSQTFGDRAVSSCDVLVSAHFHTFTVRQDMRRWHLQCPTLDGGSRWFAESYGSESTAGTLTFVTSGGRVDHIRVLEGRGWDREPA